MRAWACAHSKEERTADEAILCRTVGGQTALAQIAVPTRKQRSISCASHSILTLDAQDSMGVADFAIASVFVGVVAYFAHFGIHHGLPHRSACLYCVIIVSYLLLYCLICFVRIDVILSDAHEYLEMIVDFPVVVIAHALFVAG